MKIYLNLNEKIENLKEGKKYNENKEIEKLNY